MKNGLLICKGDGRYTKNIGDYIQSVAQEVFYDHIDCYVDREETDSVSGPEKVNLIMNGWFMFHPEHFPPSDMVNPLYISFHVVQKRADRILSEQTVRHMKKHEPIGARDYTTMKTLESYGIKSYFSGCLTLTLGLKYKASHHNNQVIFVDPYYELGGGGG